MSAKAKQTPEIEENMLVAWFERKFGFLKPHYNLIGLVTLLVVLACILGAVLYNVSRENYASQWNQLNLSFTNFINDGKTEHLTNMAAELPGTEAALWALQLAADQELSMGLNKMTNPSRFPNEDSDALRATALRQIKKAKETYLEILEAPNRPEMLEIRTVFALARASESLGEWDNAMKYYNQLVEFAPDSEFADYARRGIARVSNPDFVAFYEEFRNSKVGVAPGITLPEDQEPDISFPEIGMSNDDATQTETPNAESGENQDNDSPKNEGVDNEDSKSEADPEIDDDNKVDNDNKVDDDKKEDGDQDQ